MSRLLESSRYAMLTHLAFVVGWLAIVAPATAQLPSVGLDSISPAGAKAGSELVVTIKGNDLDDVNKLQFSHPGITATQVMHPVDEFHKTATPKDGEFSVKVAGNVPNGLYEVRAIGRYGVSNPRFFHVTTLEELAQDSSNTSYEKAMPVAVGSVVNGQVGSDTINYYKLTMNAGQRVLIDCLAQRIDSRMDATLKLFDSLGNEIQLVRDTNGLDPVLELHATEAGDYTVAVYDFTYAGGTEYFYRLMVHDAPYIDFVYPPAGQAGAKSKFTLYGRNLPGGKPVPDMNVEGDELQQLDVDITLPTLAAARQQAEVKCLIEPFQGAVGLFPYQLNSPQGASNVVNIAYATAPVVLEQEPNDSLEQTQTVTVPCEFAGQFYPRGDLDWLQFEATAGDVYWIDLVSHRYGCQTDPSILVQQITKNDQGEVTVAQVAAMDDARPKPNNNVAMAFDMSDRDPRLRFEAKADATYRIAIRDLYSGSRNDPRQIYRLVIRKESPDFNVVAYVPPLSGDGRNKNAYKAAGLSMRRGEAGVVNVWVDRQDGFDKEVTFSAQGLPAGVTCGEVIIDGDSASGELILMADGNAAAWTGNIQIVAKANINGKEETRIAQTGTLVWGTTNAQREAPFARLTGHLAMAIIADETVPAAMTAGDGKVIDTCLGAKFDLPVKVTRYGDFKGEVKAKPVGLPREVAVKDVNITAADGKSEIALTNNRLKPGVYNFTLVAPVKYKYTRNPDSVTAAQERQKELEQIVKDLTEKAKQATDKAKQAQDAANKNKEDQAAAAAATTANEAAKAAEALKKQAEDLKKKADEVVKNVTNNAKPKDVNFEVVSTVVNLRVHPDPLEVTATAPGNKKQGDKFEIPVKIERKYGFEDAVDVILESPNGVGGVSAPKVTIAKGQTDGKIAVTLAANAKPGDHQFTLRSRVKYNNVQLDDIQKLPLKIEAVEVKQ